MTAMLPVSVPSPEVRQVNRALIAELRDSKRQEVFAGQIQEKIMGIGEMLLANRLHLEIALYLQKNPLGLILQEVNFSLTKVNTLRIPDLAFVSNVTWKKGEPVPDGNAWAIAPDLAIEVASPSNTFDELMQKKLEYFEAGVKMVWLISRETKEVQIYTSRRQARIYYSPEVLTCEELFPGLQIPLEELFL